MSDEKKPDAPGVPKHEPLKDTVPHFPAPTQLNKASAPEYAATVISKKPPPSPLDYAKTQPRPPVPSTVGSLPGNPGVAAPRDPSLLATHPGRPTPAEVPPGMRPLLLRQSLASKPLTPAPGPSEATTDPMPRAAVPRPPAAIARPDPIPQVTIPGVPPGVPMPTALRATPTVTPSTARQLAHVADPPAPAAPRPIPVPEPATLPGARAPLVVPPSFTELPPAMEKPRPMGPEFATTQPGLPGPYSSPKATPDPDSLPDTLESVNPNLATASDEPVASDQVLASPAALWRRALSQLLDLAVLGAVVGGLLFVLAGAMGGKAAPAGLEGFDAFLFRLRPIAIPSVAIAVLCALAYTTLGAFLLNGRTLGRLLLGIRLVDSSGRPPGLGRSVLRAGFALASFVFFLAGFWLSLFDRRGQTLHDKLTRTFVIRPV